MIILQSLFGLLVIALYVTATAKAVVAIKRKSFSEFIDTQWGRFFIAAFFFGFMIAAGVIIALVRGVHIW